MDILYKIDYDFSTVDIYGEKIIGEPKITNFGLVSVEEYKIGKCQYCGTYAHRDTRIYWNGKAYCERCAQKRCKKCGKPGTNYCKECALKDGLTECPACHKFHQANKTCMCSTIKSYSYKPEPLFHFDKNEKETITFGMEVEIDYNHKDNLEDMEEMAYWLQENSEGLLYIKSDSSINGMELVFHPMSYRFIKNSNTIKTLINSIMGTNPSQENAGFHIHVGKKHLTPIMLYRIMKSLKDSFTQAQLLILSKRTMRDLMEWARFNDEVYPARFAKIKRQTAKHVAIAVLEETVEFRLFNGVFSFEEILNNIRTIQNIIEWSRYKRLVSLGQWLEDKRIKSEKGKK